MIVDSVEATAKALFGNQKEEPGSDLIIKSINGTIERLTEDGQLDNMKIGTLKITKKVLSKELESIYHKRVIYDDTKTIAEVKEESNKNE